MAGAGDTRLPLTGKRLTGQLVRSQNVAAAVVIANIVKSSLGPMGLDKMLVDDVGDITVTNDGATILRLMEVEHPAAKVLVELAQLQDEQVGDGTSSVVIIAAELLKAADDLVKQKIHPTTVINGYRLACKEAVRYLQYNLSFTIDKASTELVVKAAKTSMSSKLIGAESQFFAEMCVEAAQLIKVVDGHGQDIYPIKAINVLKANGKSSRESTLVHGYAINCTRASEAMPRRVANAKIACLDFGLQKMRMNLGISLVVDDPEKLEAIRREEFEITKRRVQKIIKAGASVVLSSQGIDDFALKEFVEAGVMAVRRVKKEDLKRIAKAVGATVTGSLATLENDERFDAALLGSAEEVVQERVSDDELIFVRGPKARSAASIILRGANYMMLDEVERSVHDALCVVKRVLESRTLVVGGGAVEAALNVHLESFAMSLASREQLAVAEFANALLVIPKVLAMNAAQDVMELVAKLVAFHYRSQTDKNLPNLKWAGLDLENGNIVDNREAGVFEPLVSKVKSLKFATEAAITILRIDDMITLDRAGKRSRPDDDCE